MPTIMRRRSLVSLLAIVAMVAGLMAIPVTAGAAVVDTSATCPTSIPAAGFTDIGGVQADAVSAINCIAFYKITTGTTATTYSPNNQVTRWQMALFLTRQATVHGLPLPSGADQGFTDLTGIQADAVTAINQLKQLGITTGTTATTYNPNGVVNRWQMALFLSRLATAAGVALPATPVGGGFADLTGVQADAVTAINQLFDVGITTGTTATTFNPNGVVNRWQMALFLARTAAADNVRPTELGNIVTLVAAPDVSYADATLGKVVKVTTKVTDKFSVDGTPASQGAFLAAATVGDLLDVVGTTPPTYNLTNKTAASYTAGVIDDVGATSFDIIEPISGVVLRNDFATNGTYQLFTSDGASVSVAAFNLDANAGDTVTITGKGTVTDIQTVALTNMTLSGTVKGAAAPTFGLTPFADTFTAVAADSIAIDGTTDTLANFNLELTNGDAITYARKGDKQTISLTNKASAAIAGKVLNNDESVPNTVDVDEDGTLSADEAYDNAGTVYIVNGSLDDLAGFEAAATAGDAISIVRADGEINTVDRVTLTDGAFSGTPAANVALTSVTVIFETGGPQTEAIAYNVLNPDVGLTGTGVVKYTVNANATATVAQFSAAVQSIVDGAFKGTVSVAKVGVDIVWTVTTTS